MAATVIAAQVIMCLQGILLVAPFIRALVDPQFLLGPDGNTLGRVFLYPPLLFGIALLWVALTGLRFWKISRPLALGVEGIWLALMLWLLAANLAGQYDLASIAYLAIIGPLTAVPVAILLTRPSASDWFRRL
jgi:hypothetical protein